MKALVKKGSEYPSPAMSGGGKKPPVKKKVATGGGGERPKGPNDDLGPKNMSNKRKQEEIAKRKPKNPKEYNEDLHHPKDISNKRKQEQDVAKKKPKDPKNPPRPTKDEEYNKKPKDYQFPKNVRTKDKKEDRHSNEKMKWKSHNVKGK